MSETNQTLFESSSLKTFNMICFVLLATLAFCLTEAAPSGYGYAAPHNGYESGVNKNNAIRQLHVNEVANHVGSGSGTARRDGVPGTPLGVTGHDRYSYGHGYGHGGYGHGGYGHGGYGHGGYGHGGYGGYGYGGQGNNFHGGYGGFGHGHGYGNQGNHGYGFTSDLRHGGYGRY